ncbi:PTS sugar transporter subunit IIC [Thermoflavimicrobium daqui]|jgi:PTS system cellobiose-specific IIC component|uniref:Permease IIC component n=1 Tax=Thermoflavimicrobium daqui TaxID=2137476 RepID=A0A364K439_9BACL|nr:PTS sugar transporter subunit IIC [Thermoflavimicrobium daqui]RAL24133.1 PTS sugar transporter subunit IIC [Thermoflavimicrobium daqui]
MNNFMNTLESKILPVANKIGSQRHLLAIRHGILATLPLTIIGSFFVILLNFPVEGYDQWIAPYRQALDIPFRFTVGAMALYASFGVGYALAGHYKLDQLSAGFLSVLSFFITCVIPVQVAEPVKGVIDAGRWLSISSLSAQSLFGAIVTALISVEIFRFFIKRDIRIKLPESVPPMVANSFTALVPTLVVILLFWGIRHGLGFDINSVITNLVSPLKDLLVGNSLIGGMLTVFLIVFFWTLGIHGPAILGPIIRPMWDSAILENMEVFAETGKAAQLPNLFTEQFIQWFVWIGGAGSTLALVVLFLFSKAKYLKELGKLSIVPGIFNINEPIIFGAPIVMNPILMIPFILAPLCNVIVAYTFFKLGFIPMIMAKLPFTVPAPLAAVISTDWTIMAGVLVILNFIISLCIYFPFFKMFERQHLRDESVESNS